MVQFTDVLVLAVALCISGAASKKIPSYITLCHRDDPNLNACIRNAVEQIRPHFSEGVPELSIPPMNPLVLPRASLDSGQNFQASFENIEVYHIEEFQLQDLHFDLDKVHIEMSVRFPRLRIKSQYNIDGRLLILQVKGQGPADGNFTDVYGTVMVDGNHVLKKGKDYIEINKNKLHLKLGKPVFLFENIFRDNRELNDQTNKLINENIVDIMDELQPIIDRIINEFVFSVINRIFSRFSVDELFPK